MDEAALLEGLGILLYVFRVFLEQGILLLANPYSGDACTKFPNVWEFGTETLASAKVF
ncbi:hypothetical protein [Desulfosporosinus youngiae]|uniref:hypothetical protein n=1 Tax=Desulfosporosinus youngiae TaxID=339862 RepID=UPI0002F0B153|nr:hypothetical protein [Desulfosporosinus youngiae]